MFGNGLCERSRPTRLMTWITLLLKGSGFLFCKRTSLFTQGFPVRSFHIPAYGGKASRAKPHSHRGITTRICAVIAFDTGDVDAYAQIAMRKCLDWKRRRQVAYHVSDQSLDAVSCSSTPTPEQRVIEREQQESLRDLIANLQEPYRSVMLQHYLAGLSYQEIAERTGLPLKTMESRLYRGRRMLRERSRGDRDL